MSDEQPASAPLKPAPKRHRGSGLGRIGRKWPFFVWLLFIPALLALYEYGGGYYELNGTVEFDFEAVSGREVGRIEDVKVAIGQKVTRGDLLVVLDTSLIDKEIASIKEELELDRLLARVPEVEPPAGLSARVLAAHVLAGLSAPK